MLIVLTSVAVRMRSVNILTALTSVAVKMSVSESSKGRIASFLLSQDFTKYYSVIMNCNLDLCFVI